VIFNPKYYSEDQDKTVGTNAFSDNALAYTSPSSNREELASDREERVISANPEGSLETGSLPFSITSCVS
jgi:hypothetical protein